MPAPPDPTSVYATIVPFTAFLCLAVGIGIGLLVQARIDGELIRTLEARVVELQLQAWGAYAFWDNDIDAEWDQDDADYVARVEETLKNWGPME